MTTYFVTRHPGALEWALKRGVKATRLVHLDVDRIRPGDSVIGNLPVNVAAEVCTCGGRYLHLSMTVPAEERGRELSVDEMERFGAFLEEYKICKPS